MSNLGKLQIQELRLTMLMPSSGSSRLLPTQQGDGRGGGPSQNLCPTTLGLENTAPTLEANHGARTVRVLRRKK